MAQEWTRIEGMIIGHDLDPSVVAGELKERSILAQVEWFPSSPQLLGLNVAVDKERVATVPADSTEVVPGPTPAELADELAILFDAEVRIGKRESSMRYAASDTDSVGTASLAGRVENMRVRYILS